MMQIAKVKTFFPGVVLALTIAAAANFLSEHYGAPVMLFAILIGMAFNFLMDGSPCIKGIEFCAKGLLKVGVALMGIRVTIEQILSLGFTPILYVIICVFATIGFGVLLVKVIKKGDKDNLYLGLLTAGSVAICGASAALAISLVLPKHKNSERDTLFTVIIVTVLSTIAMIFYPLVFNFLALDEQTSAMLVGMTIHDVAQVIGAGFSISNYAGEVATYVKLLRVSMLPVVIICLLVYFRQCEKRNTNKTDVELAAKKSFPWFVVGFVVILAVNSMGVIPSSVQVVVTDASKWMLVTAISALGVKTSLQKIASCGFGQISLVVIQSLFLLILATVLLAYR